MATTAATTAEVARAPRVSLNAKFERTTDGLPSVADAISPISLLSRIIAAAPEPGPFDRIRPYADGLYSLGICENRGQPLIVSAGGKSALGSWRLDGEPGPFQVAMARAEGGKPRIVVVDNDTRPLVISSSQRDLKSWTLDGESGHFNVTEAHEKGVMSLGVASGLAGPMVVSGGADGTIRIWSVDSASLYADIPEAHKRGVWTLLATEDEQHRSIVVSGSLDGSLRSWTLDGQPAGIEARGRGHVMALAQADYHGQRLVVSAHDQALRSWWLDGRAGPFAVDEAHGRGVLALATVTRDGETLVVSGGHDGDVKSWRLDGSPGIFQLPRLHSRVISLLALEHTGPVLIVGGEEGTIRSWRPHGIALVRGPGWAEMDVPTANDVQLRRMSLASPLELELHLRELIIATPLAFGFLLYAIKRLAGFPLEVRLHRAELRVQLEAAARVCKQMEEAGDAAERVDALRHDSDNLWELTDVSLTDIDE